MPRHELKYMLLTDVIIANKSNHLFFLSYSETETFHNHLERAGNVLECEFLDPAREVACDEAAEVVRLFKDLLENSP